MQATDVLLLVGGYFLLLFIISLVSSKGSDHKTFFTANRNSPWYLVAFGMIGASLSGVTFISIPGTVGTEHFSYMAMVLGYVPGYLVIAYILLPLYYKLNLTSIYSYLGERFGDASYKVGAAFFLLSRIIGSSLRLYLVAMVLDLAIGEALGLSFPLIVLISVMLIYVYTFRAGIKTVVWTDTIQTATMLLAAGTAIVFIGDELSLSAGEMFESIQESAYSSVNVPHKSFFMQFINGMLIAIVMTGLDQDMMQKNLTCKNLKEAQKNVVSLSVVLIGVNLLFLCLGAALYLYGDAMDLVAWENGKLLFQDAEGWNVIQKDQLFPRLALEVLGGPVAMLFLIGAIAAAYSSADSALTAMTTSFYIDILGKSPENEDQKTRKIVHLGFALVMFVVILIFWKLADDSVIWAIFKIAGYTYGPLLGLFACGMFTQLNPRDKFVPLICILAPLAGWGLTHLTPLFGYTIGFELLLYNGILTFVGLWLVHQKAAPKEEQLIDEIGA